MTVEFQGLVEGALLGSHLRNDPVGARLPTLVPRRVEQFHLPDAAELVEQLVRRALHALPLQLPLQQAAQEQGQHAAEDMHLDLLIRPVVLRSQRDAVPALHRPERAFHMVLRAIAPHDLRVAPVVVVREQQRLAEQRGLQPLPSLGIEGVLQRRQALPLPDRDAEQVAQVPRAQPAVDFLGHARDRRRPAALHFARVPAGELGGQGLQFPAALPDQALQRPRLGLEQVLVVGHHDRALDSVDIAPNAPGAHTRQALRSQIGQLRRRRGQQVGIVGGHQRADHVELAGVDEGQIGLGIIALVEDERDGLARGADRPAAGGELAAEAAEQGRVGLVAGVGAVEERQVEVAGGEQGHAHDPQRGAALLAMAALGQAGLVVEGVEEGEEIGGVEEHLAQVDLEVADEGGDEVAFDGLDGVRGEAVEVVPEALAGELAGLDGEQPGEHGAVEPSGDARFGAGREAAIEDGDEQVGADGGAGAAFGDVAVDVLDEAQALGEVEEGRGAAEVADEGARGGRDGGVGALGDDVVDAAEVPGLDDLGAAVDARGLAGVVIGLAMDVLADEARHGLGHTVANREHRCQGMFKTVLKRMDRLGVP